MFFSSDWQSLGEYSTEYYTEGRMGTAFSMILESMLNFWYFGPVILGISITTLYFKSLAARPYIVKALYLIWFIVIIKLVRSELTVVLKLYLAPSLIALLFFIIIFRPNTINRST